MLITTAQGLYCPHGDFFIDPKGKVARAVITHAHSDHARRGGEHYYCVHSGVSLLQNRLGKKIALSSFAFGQKFSLGPITLSFHPAGHILGSSQVRLEYAGEVWVVSGDYKREKDPTCEPFEVVSCDVFVTEATFGTPRYRWDKSKDQGQEIYKWWQHNASNGFNSVVHAYSLGKTQRILGALLPYAQRPIYTFHTASSLIDCYRAQGVALAANRCLSTVPPGESLSGELILAPPSFTRSQEAPLLLGEHFRTAFASGWMSSSTYGYDRGFVMSDHADWDDLLRTIQETGAKKIYVQHRGHGALVSHLKKLGLSAFPEEELTETTSQLSLF